MTDFRTSPETEMFKHSHVQALWDGWFARACLDDRKSDLAPTPGLQLEKWLDKQIAEAAGMQTASFLAGKDLQGERWHARQCAIYEVKLKLNMLAASPDTSTVQPDMSVCGDPDCGCIYGLACPKTRDRAASPVSSPDRPEEITKAEMDAIEAAAIAGKPLTLSADPRVPKVRTSHHRNKEEAARLQKLVDDRFAPSDFSPDRTSK
jgi:hypothetical protein